MRRRTHRLGAVLLSLMLLAAACTGGDDTSTESIAAPLPGLQPAASSDEPPATTSTLPSPTSPIGSADAPTTTQALSAADEALRERLRAASLAVDDLAGSWTLVSTDENPHQGSLFCDTPFEAGTVPLFRLTKVFQERESGAVLSQRISAYPDGGADAVMREFRKAIDGCDEWTKLTETGSQTWNLLPLAMDPAGDDLIALDLPSTVGGVTIDNHFVMMREGGVITILGYGGPFVDTIDPDITAAFVRLAADKLDGVA